MMQDDKRIVVADLEHFEQNALDELVLQWRAKRPRNNLRSALYDMKNSERSLMSAQVPEVIRRRSYVLGWSAIAVDKLNRRCNVDSFYDANGTDLDDLGLSEFMRDNRLTSELNQAGTSSLIHAVSWLVTTQGDTKAGEPEVLTIARDASVATGFWDVRRRAVRSFLSINELDDQGEPIAMTMYLPDLNVIMTKTAGSWKVERRTHSYGVPVDPMRYKPRLGRPLGSSRISRAVMSIHMQALSAMMRADVNGEGYSLARFVLLGATEQAFTNADGSPKAAWQAAWDAVWAVGDDPDAAAQGMDPRADVKQFHGQSPEPQNAHLRMLAQLFSGETGIPVGELGITSDSNPTSAESLQVSRDDLISEAETTTDCWGPDASSSVTRALTMLNKGSLPDNLDVRAKYRSPLHVSRAQAADSGTKVLEKAPWLAETTVGLELLGLTSDQITRAYAERQRSQGRAILDRLVPQPTEQTPAPADDNA